MADAGEGPAHPGPEVLDAIVRHLESAWPLEGCGVVLRQGTRGPWRCRPLRNARAARDAYAFDPAEWLGVLREADARGEQLMWVFHSHVSGDGDAGFSREDRRQAAPGGEPLLPGVSYLVMALRHGRVTARRLFRWEGKDFQPVEIP